MDERAEMVLAAESGAAARRPSPPVRDLPAHESSAGRFDLHLQICASPEVADSIDPAWDYYLLHLIYG